MPTLVDDIVQALKNLNGQATAKEIYKELEIIRIPPSPKTWPGQLRLTLEINSSDSKQFKGEDYFRKIGNGVWGLRNYEVKKTGIHRKPENHVTTKLNYSTPDSFDTITNLLKTIKEYRDFSDPTSPTWIDYIQEFFHVLGFNTEKKDSRIFLLKDMGELNDPIAVVSYINPGENFEEIGSGIMWDTYLLFAANYYQVDWGILFNGLQLKVINTKDPKNQSIHYWRDFDGIIQHERSVEFFTIYKLFSNLRAIEGNGLLLKNTQESGNGLLLNNTRESETSRVANYSDRCNFQSIIELCKKKGDAVIVGFTGGEKALASRDIASLENRMYKWDNTTGGNGIKDLHNWIRGSVFTSLIDEKYLQIK